MSNSGQDSKKQVPLLDLVAILKSMDSKQLSPQQPEVLQMVFCCLEQISPDMLFQHPFTFILPTFSKELLNSSFIGHWVNLLEKQIKQLRYLSELHCLYLQTAIRSKHYKRAYEFVKGFHFTEQRQTQTRTLQLYFYYAGVVCQAERDFANALRFQKYAIKLDSEQELTREAIKMKELLVMRTLETSSSGEKDSYSQTRDKIQQYLSGGMAEDDRERGGKIDADVTLCEKECQLLKSSVMKLQSRRMVFLKVDFETLERELGLKGEQLIKHLLQVNDILDMFWIDESYRCIEFKETPSDFGRMNAQLEERIELVKVLLSAN